MKRARLIAAAIAATALLIVYVHWLAPPVLRSGVEFLFLSSAFTLRLRDRRWSVRSGWQGRTSHMRINPARMLVWILAVLAAGYPALIAALVAELLLYPMMTRPFGALHRAGLLASMIVAGAIVEGLTRVGWGFELLRCLGVYASGVMLGIFWLRGPDGEPEAALISGGGVTLFAIIAVILPASQSWSIPAASACLLLLIAHLTTLRRAPMQWRGHSASSFRLSFRRPQIRPASPPA